MSERPSPVSVQSPGDRLAALRVQREKVDGLAKRGFLGGGYLAAVDERIRQLEGLEEEIVVLANGNRGKRFTPAGSKESVALGLKEWEVVSRLPYLPQAVSGPDLVEMFFGEQIRGGEIARRRARVLIHSFIKHSNQKLSLIGWIVFNTKRGEIDEQKGVIADARWGLTRIEQLSEADREALGFPIRIPVVVNGGRFYIGQKQACLLRFLVINPGKDMTSKELSLGAFGESDPRKAHLKDFWARLKSHLASFPALSLSTSGLANVHRKYRLDIAGDVQVVKIDGKEIVPGSEAPAKDPAEQARAKESSVGESVGESKLAAETLKLPSMVINLKTGEVVIDGEVRVVDGRINRTVLELFALNPNRRVSREQVIAAAMRAGSGERRGFLHKHVVERLRRSLGDSMPPVLIKGVEGSRKAGYTLAAQVIFVQPDSVKRSPRRLEGFHRKIKDLLTLPNGSRLLLGPVEVRIGGFLLETLRSGEPVTYEGMAGQIYRRKLEEGYSMSAAVNTLIAVMGNLKRKLRDADYQVRNLHPNDSSQSGRYILEEGGSPKEKGAQNS